MPSAETLNISQPDLLERSRRGEHLPFDPRRGFRGNQCALGFPARACSSPDPFNSRRRAPCPHSNLQLEKNFAEHLSLFCRMEMASPCSHFSLKLKRTLHFRTISGLSCLYSPGPCRMERELQWAVGFNMPGDLSGRPPPRERKMQKEPGKLSQTSDH